MISNNHFIMVWNCFTDINNEYRLSPDELYIWCYLYTLRMYDDTVITNIDLIEQFMSLKLHHSKSHINKDRIRSAFLSLINKRVLIIDDVLGDVQKNGFKIGLQCWTSKDKRYNKGIHFDGYEPLTYNDFFTFTDVIDFYIWNAVKRFNSIGGRDCSDEEWAKLLDVSESTSRRRVKKLVDEKVLYKRSGKWENEKKQGKNKYKTEPFDENVELNEEAQVEEEDLSIFDLNLDRKLGNIEWGNWNNPKVYLDENDFYLYWLQYDDVEFSKVCDLRINKTTNNKSKDKFDGWSKEGKSRADNYWNKKKKDYLINAVSYENRILFLNKDNVDKVNWSKVKEIYYHTETKHEDDNGNVKISYVQGNGEFKKLTDQDNNGTAEMEKRAINEYKKIVRSGERLTIDHIQEIREKVKS